MFVDNRLVCLVLAWLLVMPVHASSVKSVTISEVVSNTALIFEGSVSGSRVVQKPGSRVIHTLVTFEILDIVKGEYDESSIELSFLGGSARDITMHVTDLHQPRVGDRGIYFVENPARAQVNPLYGWDQGHFVIKYQPALGRMAVMTRSGKVVYGVEKAVSSGSVALSDGVARGITIHADTAGGPLTPTAFKDRIRELMK